MPNAVKYWNGSAWKSPQYFGKVRMWNGTTWRTVEVKYAGAAGSDRWNVPIGALDYQEVTSVYLFNAGDGQYVPSYYTSGYSGFYGAWGSISDGTSNIYGGAQIVDLYYTSGPYLPIFYFTVSGNRSNSGWTNLSVGGYTFSRSSATYAYNSSSNISEWSWQSENDPFNGSSGNNQAFGVIFT